MSELMSDQRFTRSERKTVHTLRGRFEVCTVLHLLFIYVLSMVSKMYHNHAAFIQPKRLFHVLDWRLMVHCDSTPPFQSRLSAVIRLVCLINVLRRPSMLISP